MEIPAWLMGAVIIGGLGFYYWWSFGRHGGNLEGYQKHQLQLKEGETLTKYFFGAFHLDKEKKDVALALVDIERIGKPLQFGLTNQNRLIYREHAAALADEPVSLEKDQIEKIEVSNEAYGTLVGLSGKLENVHLVQIHLKNGQLIKVDVPISGAEVIREWAS